MRKGYIDAEFEVVSGPLRVGDEHPIRKGWFLTDKVGRHGEPLWYKPPGPVSRWIRRIGVIGYLALMALGIGSTILTNGGQGWG